MERSTVIHPTLLPTPANSDRRFSAFQVTNHAGATDHADLYYERALGEAGRQGAALVGNRIEDDLATIEQWFGCAPLDGRATVVVGRLPSLGATWELDGGAVTLQVDLPVVPQPEPLQASFFVACLLADLAARAAGWDPALAGVLARATATALYPRRVAGFTTGWVWLESEREDVLAGPLPDTMEAVGCATLFVNYLHHQLGLSWGEIVGQPAPSLAVLAERLTGGSGEPASFCQMADRWLARGKATPAPVDNIFPIPDLPVEVPEPPAAVPLVTEGERRVCLLTGASGTLGRYLCERYGDGFQFAGVYLNRPPADGVHAIQADLTADGEPERVVQDAIERFGHIDLLVNAAVSSTWGPMLSSEPLWSSAPQQFLTNVVAPLRLASAAARLGWADRREENRSARRNVVNVSSVSGQHIYAGEGQSVYAASKAALDHLTGHMAVEFEAIGVRVNAVAPNSFPANVPTERVARAVIDLDEGEGSGAIVVVDGAADRVIQLAPTAVPVLS